MKDKNRDIVTKLEISDNDLLAIHALEVIDNEITGVYFHAYLKDKYRYNDMYYLARYQHFGGNYIQNFINFVGDSKLITCNDEFELIKSYFKNKLQESVKLNNDLFKLARKNGININTKSRRGGLIDCTIFARLLYDKKLNKSLMTKMTGIFSKRKYYKKERKKEDDDEEDYDDSDDQDNEDDEDIINQNIFSHGRFIVIDVDTTSFKRKNCRLIAIHSVEVINGQLTGKFFHTFINKRDYNYDFMYFLVEYNYCLEKYEKLKKFLGFVGNSPIVAHNVKYDIRHINKELIKNNLPKINKNKCICTMNFFKKLQNHTLKGCAEFFGIKGIYDYHKGIVDATVLSIIVCIMAENNDKNYNIDNEKIKEYHINDRLKVYIFSDRKKFHLYSSCGNLMYSERITAARAKKIGKELCEICRRKSIKEIKYYF